MTSIHSNPTNLTTATKFKPPGHTRSYSGSKSPARSPYRKAQFAAKELDPLLQNLSPDSTLEALQETNAFKGNQAEQNAIVSSISDATESERELGIRAAVAAKKLNEWTDEVSAWKWPSRHDRGWGAGFVSPLSDVGQKYFGSLGEEQLRTYEERLDEIWDAIDTLQMAELKDFVFSSHQPSPGSAMGSGAVYGRMRDFTALITAIVIQSLPVLANLYVVLEAWSVRLVVSRQIPDLLDAMSKVKEGLVAITDIVKDDTLNRKLSKKELDTGKAMFGSQVAGLGKRVDNLLDMLEGQEDSLPQAWIDQLEDLESRYAEWAAQAEHIVLRNEMRGCSLLPDIKLGASQPMPHSAPAQTASEDSVVQKEPPYENKTATASSPVKRKPLLEINPKHDASHKRGKSEVSMAESNFSAYSFENAEIVDAEVAPVLPSPRISIIENPIGSLEPKQKLPVRDQSGPATLSPQRPPILQRASAASIEPISKAQIKEVTLRRGDSQEMLSNRGSRATTRSNTPTIDVLPTIPDPPENGLRPGSHLPPLATSPSPSLRVDPLDLKGKDPAIKVSVQSRPIVPRRSSKRLSMPLLGTKARPSTPPQQDQALVNRPKPTKHVLDKLSRAETFDHRLKTILASIPAKIKLTDNPDSDLSDDNLENSSRSTSPTHALKLSPVHEHKTSQPGQSAIRVYQLKGSRTKDAPPVKLYVRPVGEHGERIMVRVGGGWADLAEYLREYSQHHGGRGLLDPRVEVADFPNSTRQSNSCKVDSGFDFGLSEPGSATPKDATSGPWRPLPVPLVPHGMIGQAKTSKASRERLRSNTPTPSSNRASKRYSTTVITTPAITTTSTTRYTPLGGAGPVQPNRRVVSSPFSSPRTEPALEGTIKQIRASSGSYASPLHPATSTVSVHGNTNIISPTTTVTMSTFPAKPRKTATLSRRLSSWTSLQPLDSEQKQDSSDSLSLQTSNVAPGARDSSTSRTSSAKSDRRRSMMSLGDVGGIRRVFLRNKSDK